jgi:hypothetical protein
MSMTWPQTFVNKFRRMAPAGGVRLETRPPAPRNGGGSTRQVLQAVWCACVDTLWPGNLPADVVIRKRLRERELAVLHTAKDEFDSVLSDLPLTDVAELQCQIDGARSLQELWHLRVGVFGAVSRHHQQDEAARRLARLNHHFPTRAARSGFAPMDDAT